MISTIKPDFYSPELFTITRTVVDYRLLNAVKSQKYQSPEVVFADDNLAYEICTALSIPEGEVITQVELKALLSLTAESAGITELSGLEYATNLLQLALSANEISDLSPLNGLAKLTHLSLSNNDISDLSVLTDLPALVQLAVNYNNITDISPVTNFDKLEILAADGNNITDIVSLNALVDIQYLSLVDNNITDISVIENYPALTGVYLSGNPLDSIEPLRNATSVEIVVLNNISISDFSALAAHEKLRHVEISGNNITDISFLEKSKDCLVALYAECNDITDLSPIRHSASLQMITLYNNPFFSDISPLEDASQLVIGVIAETAVTDLTHINASINGLYVSRDNITDFTSLVKTKHLLEFYAVDTGIEDLSFMQTLTALNWVVLDENCITDLRVVTQRPCRQFSVADQAVELQADGIAGQPTNLALFNPDGTVPDITWVTPGVYDPIAETVTWDKAGVNILTWNVNNAPLYVFSGTLVQFVNS